jgi:hypothetical protein
MTKSKAIKRVKEALFLAAKKSSLKAMIVLSDLVSNLTRSPHFDKNETLVDYLDHFKRKMAVHNEHPNLVSLEHRSKLQYTWNYRPLSLARDIDFAENGSIENFDRVQSEHWISKQYTLFMSITSFLKVDEWNDEENKLDIGAQVIVNGERYVGELKVKTQINLDLHWAKVIGHIDGSKDVYQVKDEGGRSHEMLYSSLWHCSRHIICCGHITDD